MVILGHRVVYADNAEPFVGFIQSDDLIDVPSVEYLVSFVIVADTVRDKRVYSTVWIEVNEPGVCDNGANTFK